MPWLVRGGAIGGRDAADRLLRVSQHLDRDRVVLSIWDHGVCMATFRLAPEDVPELVRALSAALVPAARPEPVDPDSDRYVYSGPPPTRPPGAAPPVPPVPPPPEASYEQHAPAEPELREPLSLDRARSARTQGGSASVRSTRSHGVPSWQLPAPYGPAERNRGDRS